MESRKRLLADDVDRAANKKRATASISGSPMHANGMVDSPSPKEPHDEDDLEQFRKEAIFRRMRHYCRESNRCQNRISELEQSRYAREAEVAVMDACWTQLVDSIRRFVNVEDHVLEGQASDDFDIDVPEEVKAHASRDVLVALQRRMQLTKNIVATFVKVAGSGGHWRNQGTASQCQRTMSECTTLNSELRVVQAKLKDCQQECDRYHNELIAAESRLDRMRSKSLNAMHTTEPEMQPNSASIETKVEVKAEGSREVSKHVSPPPRTQSPPPTNGARDLQWLVDQERYRVENRDFEIVRLERENATLQDQLVLKQSEVALLTEDVVTTTPCYKLLAEQASQHIASEKTAREELTRLRDELIQLQEGRHQWQEEVMTTASKESSNFKAMVAKRDEDIVRLRQQRDQLDSQVKELKSVLSGKWSSLDSYKSLAESRAERIIVLTSEVTRLRTRLAAAAGDDDLLQFLAKDTELTMDYANDLKQRLAQTEAHCHGLKKTLADRDPSRVSLELASVRQQLISTEQRLASYEADAADTRSMESQLKDCYEQIKVLKLTAAQAEQETSALCSEVDKLSAAWEALDRQLQTQAMSIEKWEDERDKLNIAKARSDNKYYKAMSDQEAKENERKQAARTLDRQTKIIDNLTKSEKALQQSIEVFEKEIAQYKKLNNIQLKELNTLEAVSEELRVKSTEDRKKLNDYIERFQQRESMQAERTQEILNFKDEVARLKKELLKAAERAKVVPVLSGTSSEREAQLQEEVEKCMRVLKCSTCHNAMRSTVITKCMHSFCKGCVDARISHRQRKCPACNLAFSQSDVQTLYFQ